MPECLFDAEELRLAEKIISFSRREAARKYSFLEKGIYCLNPAATGQIAYMAADYEKLYYNPKSVIERFSKKSSQLVNEIVHCVLHCMLNHPSFSLPDEELFDACADASVEAMLEQDMNYSSHGFRELLVLYRCGTTAKLYNAAVEDVRFQKNIKVLSDKYCDDDHSVWRNPPTDCESKGMNGGTGAGTPKPNKPSAGAAGAGNGNLREQEKVWETMYSEAKSQQSMTYGNESGNIFKDIEPPSRFSRFSYIEYLKRFASAELTCEDPETFDLMLYTAGMDMYEDMCFVEPYEVREMMTPTDIIFAIDMSGSCGGATAVNFLRQIYSLFETMNIKSGVNIHVLFFDTEILKSIIIRSRNDADDFIKNYKGIGFGGTDFNCVFEYANSFSEKSHGRKLKALFFFSDAYGAFPMFKPDYKTTFFVPVENCCDFEYSGYIPDWIELVKYDDQ